MDFQSHPSGPGFVDGPLTPDNYKRGVYRPPPSNFTVEMLGAAKKGGGYSYGMRVSPVVFGDRSSVTSRGPDFEYEVWRRWDDCLWFQGNLELEYSRMARSKRQRLLRGKGVRKEGFYRQDQASSWESLPPGPDPNSVARDIHEHVPMLTKKGTVFRASHATIEQRAVEFKAMIEGLLKDDVPALIEELRNSRIVTDFFAIWRRDFDLSEKQKARSIKPRTSVTSSVFSMYFSSSNLNLHDTAHHERPSNPRISSTPHHIDTSGSSFSYRSRKSSSDSSDASPSRPTRPRASSSASSDFSSTQSERSLDSPANTTAPTIIVEELPITFNHNPHRRSDPYIVDRASSVLAALPEDREICLKTNSLDKPPPIRRRRKSSADETRERRSGGIFFSPTDSFVVSREPLMTEQRLLTLPERAIRESWQTTDSASCILDGIGVTMPTSPMDYSHRLSVSSIATFMTDCSADAVIPSLDTSSPTRKNRPRISCPVSISEDEDDGFWPESDNGILDIYLSDQFPLPCFDIATDSRPETPVACVHAQAEPSTPSFSPVPPSPTKSTAFSMSTISPTSDKLAIKAAFNNSIILLRVDEGISYKEMRQRIYTKFVGQEGIPLSESFTITFLQPLQTTTAGKTRARSNSVSSDPGTTQLHMVTSQSDWENVTTSLECSKLTLRITDDTTS
ncbi:hypothetical protein BDZ94DRAFT_1288245 [Collybia nuda]|uniref:PX domain-containing protein n=1 Tax=Collybia nuda TaxID=64659 RepID=A0A9P5YCB8_9AGAR|nr:hypothetical protein BDZ94DRAFT_1288245 [Collybia nuda]